MENDKYFLFSPFHFQLPHHVIRTHPRPMVGTLGRNNTRQRIYRLLRPQPAFHLEPVQPPGGRHGQRAYRHRRGTRNTRRYLGSQRTRLADSIIRLRQDRCRLRNGKHQLQTVRAGISLPELRHAYPLHRQWRKGQ